MKEIWKDIPGYEGLYQASNLGRIRSIDRLVNNTVGLKQMKGRILKPINGKYLKVGLSKNGIQKPIRIHRLVALTFIQNPNNYPYVNHKDENKHNNCVDNLEWCTNLYNIYYGERNKKVSVNNSKCKIVQKDKNDNIIKIWNNIWELTHNTNYKKDNIYYCCCGKYKYAYGYKWERISI